ncbi:uncharacterized protein LOC115877126 [Sitophilus oryzae]|uniref:Uncharacterized protein LOC115874924 n=1 Tax=Sitophilus oryzae TaxID=7048 RepID=A0A6J2XEE5_SITOR|nr:uncharacterized protein LOC115874924 [Sitophilus oryzae]XP_030749154.1 uncharacterized protein LOC115877126 [Sitophilus oryzae]
MVRTYKKKRPNRPEIPSNVLKDAVRNVINKTMSLRAAAITFNIPKSTLFDSVAKAKKRLNDDASDSGNEGDDTAEQDSVSKYATRQVFSQNEEAELELYLIKCSKICYGLTYKLCRELAFEYATKLAKKCPKSWEINKTAGIDWMQSFMKRHPRLSNRKPENTSIARASAFNKTNVDEFFKNYAEVQAKYSFSPDRIWNIDETGITTVLQAPRVIAEIGSKAVGQCVSAERGSLVTMCGIISAVGGSIPPLYIFPRIRMKDQFLYGAVPGAVGFAEKSGWMSANIFLKLLEHIKTHTNCNPLNRILILMDNHETHVSLNAILYAREHGIVLLSFPPHCTHRMQPLDKAVFGPFKAKCKASFNDFILSNPGKPITIYDVAKLTAQPYLQTFTPYNIISSFKSTGLWPINSLAYTDDDFCASFATDRPDTSLVVQSNFNNEVQDHDVEAMARNIIEDIVDEATKPRIKILSMVTVKPIDVKPLPKACPRKTTRKSRVGKSRIYTSTPEKNRIDELERIRQLKLKKTDTKRKLVSEITEKKTQNGKSKKKKYRTKRQVLDDISSSDSDTDMPSNFIGKSFKNDLSDSDIDLDFEDNNGQINELLHDEKILEKDYVLVKFATKKRVVHYVGKVVEVLGDDEFQVTFLKKSPRGFVFPQIKDISTVERKDVVSKLAKPSATPGTSRMASYLQFNVNFFGYNVQ